MLPNPNRKRRIWGAVMALHAQGEPPKITKVEVDAGKPDPELTEKRKVSAVHGSWRKRTPEGVVVTARGNPVRHREFLYRLVTCHTCGRTTIDHHMHHCVAGWQIAPDRTVCDECARKVE